MIKSTKKQEIIEGVKSYSSSHGLSQNDVSRLSGVSARYLSAMWNGGVSVTNDNGSQVEIADKYWCRLADFAGVAVSKAYWKTVATPQMERILLTLQVARENGETNLVVGDTGCGKSYACDIFRRKYPQDTWIVTVSQTDTISDLIDKMLSQLRLNVGSRTRTGKLNAIARHLSEKRANGLMPMLVFDESEYMKQPALCAMKSLYDSLYGSCALILVGTDQLLANLDSLRRKNKNGIPQFYRRVKFGIRKLEPVDRRFPGFLDGIADKALVRFVRENCDNYGELHDVLAPAMREADITGSALTAEFVKTVLNFR